jgi:hypothetical protein
MFECLNVRMFECLNKINTLHFSLFSVPRSPFPSRIFRIRFSFSRISRNSLLSLPIFENNFFETTYTMAHGRTRPCPSANFIGDRKSAGELTRAPNTSCFYQLFRLFSILKRMSEKPQTSPPRMRFLTVP